MRNCGATIYFYNVIKALLYDIYLDEFKVYFWINDKIAWWFNKSINSMVRRLFYLTKYDTWIQMTQMMVTTNLYLVCFFCYWGTDHFFPVRNHPFWCKVYGIYIYNHLIKMTKEPNHWVPMNIELLKQSIFLLFLIIFAKWKYRENGNEKHWFIIYLYQRCH